MADDCFTILDHIDKITVPGQVYRQPANEYWELLCLWEGMEALYYQARKCEAMATQATAMPGKDRFIWGNHPALSVVPKKLLTCMFHWYAVSACNYVRTIGEIARRQDNSRQKARDYVLSIIPEVYAFRDKIAAHFAWTINDSRDNEAEKAASIFPQLSLNKGVYYMGTLNLTKNHAGQTASSQAIQPWSISKVHEELRQRYRPQPVISDVQTQPAKDDNS